ncbi:MAG: hypothetical protein IJY92_04550 [Alphaproteobacteria bacterium]|nr:hypothetical protein [Alphaproteobacteria bacterium]
MKKEKQKQIQSDVLDFLSNAKVPEKEESCVKEGQSAISNELVGTENSPLPSALETQVSLLPEEEYELASLWANRIQTALKIYEPYYEVVKKARNVYKTGASNASTGLFPDMNFSTGYNIFWSGIETQKPFLYFKQPKPFVERLSWNISPAEKVAATILERALLWNLNKFDFDSALKYARNDYLISGCGILWETYVPTFETVSFMDQEIQLKTDEKVVSTYVDPLNFLMDTTHLGIFEDVTWIARRISMQPKDIYTSFGLKAYEMLMLETSHSSLESDLITIDVYEIWDKETKRVYYFAPAYPSAFLKIQNDPLHLEGFFPIAKPIFSSLTNDSLLPKPDYQMVETILDELKGVTDRMRLVMQAIKISGVYDTSFSRLKDIFDKDVTLVGVHDFDRLKESGGLKGVIDFIPISQYITALEVLIKRRDELKNELFEITGVSDIMRGSSNKVETATAVEKKTGFGTLRTQDRQNDMQRFIQNAYRIKAEIICEHFDDLLLKSFISPEEEIAPQVLEEAVLILKTGKLRNMVLSIETEAFFNPDGEALKTIQAVETISKLLNQGILNVSKEPNLLPLYKEMITQVATSLPHARQFENVIEQSFSTIQKVLDESLKKENLTPPSMFFNPQKIAEQQALEKLKTAISQSELSLKQKELAFKERELFYKSKKAELDFFETVMKSQVEGEKSRLRYAKPAPETKASMLQKQITAPFLKKRGSAPLGGQPAFPHNLKPCSTVQQTQVEKTASIPLKEKDLKKIPPKKEGSNDLF